MSEPSTGACTVLEPRISPSQPRPAPARRCEPRSRPRRPRTSRPRRCATRHEAGARCRQARGRERQRSGSSGRHRQRRQGSHCRSSSSADRRTLDQAGGHLVVHPLAACASGGGPRAGRPVRWSPQYRWNSMVAGTRLARETKARAGAGALQLGEPAAEPPVTGPAGYQWRGHGVDTHSRLKRPSPLRRS
jgi:hypothetical protein